MRGITHVIPDHSHVLTSFGGYSQASVPRRFKVLVWNIHKARKARWAGDFCRLIADKDLVLLQEAFLRPAMKGVLEKSGHLRWDLAAGFTSKLNDIDAGVMTGCRAEPVDLFFLRSPVHEPLVRLPKMAIGTKYRIHSSRELLFVLNVHAINFVRFDKFKRQMRQLERELGNHSGPIILGGDFNTWLAQRSDFLKGMTGNLHLDLATFSPDRRSRYFGKVLDYVFVRGLDIVSASCHYEIRSSDHQPIEMVLQLCDNGDGSC